MVRINFDFGFVDILNPEDISVLVKFDNSINAQTVTVEGELKFAGKAYNELYTSYLTLTCEVYSCRLQVLCNNIWTTFSIGEIYTTDAKFDLDKCIVSVPFNDIGFASNINTNKAIEVSINSVFSRNEVPILAARSTEITFVGLNNVEFPGFVPNINSNTFPIAYFAGSAFQNIIEYISDAKIGYISDYFTVGNGRKYVVTSGRSLRSRTGDSPKVSFENLFDFFRKKLNLAFGFETIDNKVYIRIEESSYFQSQTEIFTINNLTNIIRSIDQSKIYAAIDVGAGQVTEVNECDNGNTPCSMVQFPYVAFKDEQFAICGSCNLDNVLDLRTNELICDSNTIQDIVQFNNTGYDDSVVIIDFDFIYNLNIVIPGLPFVVQRSDPLNILQFQWNQSLTNNQSINNWIGSVPCSVISSLAEYDPVLINGSGNFDGGIDPAIEILLDDNFPAPLFGSAYEQSGITQAFNNIVQIGTNIYYELGTFYISPTIQFCTINFQYNIDAISAAASQFVSARPVLIILDSFGNIIKKIFGFETAPFFATAPLPNQPEHTFANVLLNVGDILRFDVEVRRVNNVAGPGGLIPVRMIVRRSTIVRPWQTSFSLTFTNYLLPNNLEQGLLSFNARLANFSYQLNNAQFLSIINNPGGIIKWGESNQVRIGRINSATINGIGTTYETEFEIIE